MLGASGLGFRTRGLGFRGFRVWGIQWVYDSMGLGSIGLR